MQMIIICYLILLKLSNAITGNDYQVTDLDLVEPYKKRLAIMGLNNGVVVQILASHTQGSIIQTASGKLALDTEIIEAIEVTEPQ